MHTVLSIQSAVAFGHAGNSSAVFPLQRSGVEVWPVHTVLFSNHTGYGAWRGPHIPAHDVTEVVQGIDDRGVLGRADALLAGYQGSADMGQAILGAARLVKERNPEAVFCADPVMGDVGRGFFAAPGIPEFMKESVVPAADIMTPNLFELEYLTGHETQTLADVLAAAEALRERGPRTVVVTSVVGADMEPGVMRMIAVDDTGAQVVATPMLDRNFVGSGDITTAVFLAHWLRTHDIGQALSMTASVVYSILEATALSGEPELQLVAAQDSIVAPKHRFEATPLH